MRGVGCGVLCTGALGRGWEGCVANAGQMEGVCIGIGQYGVCLWGQGGEGEHGAVGGGNQVSEGIRKHVCTAGLA